MRRRRRAWRSWHRLTDTDGDGIDDAHDVCVAAKDPGQEDADKDGLGDACLPFITQRDLELSVKGSANVPLDGASTLEFTLRNTYPKPALGAVVQLTPPAGVQLDTTRWEVGEVPARGEKTLTVTARGSAVGRGDLTAELIALTDTDWDSTPNNHDPAEDDQVAKRLTVFQAGAVGTVSLPERSAREGDEGPHAGSVRIEIANPSGTSISGRLRSAGGTATAGSDYKAVDQAVELSPFSTETNIPITLYGDTLDEGDETIEFELSGIDGAQPDTVRGTFTITDDDAPLEPGQLAWLGCTSRDFGEGTCDQREPLLRAPAGTKALTPDGKFLWIPDDERLVRLTRDPLTGALGNAKCWTTYGVERGGCPRLGTTDLDPMDVAVSPDGKTLFMTGSYEIEGRSSPGMGLVSLALDANGDPSPASCIACDEFLQQADLAVSPDGRFVLTFGSGQQRDHGEITVYPVLDGVVQPAARCYAHPAENKPCEPLTVNLDGPPYFDWSGDGKTLAVRSKDHLALLGWKDGVLSLDAPATACTLNGDKVFVCPPAPAYLAGEIAELDRLGLGDKARTHFGLRPDLPVLLVTGGSQGARSLNAAVFGAAEWLRDAGVQVLHVIGPRNGHDAPASRRRRAVRGHALHRPDGPRLRGGGLRAVPGGRDDLRRAHRGRPAGRLRAAAHRQRRAAAERAADRAAGRRHAGDRRRPDLRVDPRHPAARAGQHRPGGGHVGGGRVARPR